MISLICGIQKNDTNELIYKTEMDSDIENKYVGTKGKKLWGGINWEFGLTYSHYYI